MRAWILALALGGCGFSSAAGPSNGQDSCLGTLVKVCADAPRGSLTLTGMIDTSDTSSSTKCLPSTAYTTEPAVDACVIASQTITIPGGDTVTATGGKRLILLADEVLTITGTLDAASHRKGLSGPAADTGPCPTNFTNPTTATEGGGSWGGTFGKPGNNGGNTPGGGMGGGAGSALQILALGGGCPGGTGANNSTGNGAGSGGHGGGAVLLLAGQSIAIDGAVNASGAGGAGGKAKGGGGGGGSGGMIVLEAPMVRITGKCFANGGGGGQGSSRVVDGGDGGESSAPDAPGGGGSMVTVGGPGGAGGVGITDSKAGANGTTIGMPFNDTGGGGAGGGGVGVIKILSADRGNITDPRKVAPPPS